jgi:hypothetical protein
VDRKLTDDAAIMRTTAPAGRRAATPPRRTNAKLCRAAIHTISTVITNSDLGLHRERRRTMIFVGCLTVEAAMTYFLKAATVLDQFLPELDGFKPHVDLS